MSSTAATRTALRELAVGRPPARRAGVVPRGLVPQKSDASTNRVDVENNDGSGNINGFVDGSRLKTAGVANGSMKQPGETEVANGSMKQPGETEIANGSMKQPGETEVANVSMKQPGETEVANGSMKQPGETEVGAENEAPAGPPAIEFEYIQSEDLEDVPNPEECVGTLLQRLDSKDWIVVSEALNNVRQLAVHRKNEISSTLDQIVGSIIKSIKNPRSALCKTAIMATADLCRCFGDDMVNHVDSLLLQLLLKASQDKRFVCEEAEKTLFVMTECLAPDAILQKLISYAAHRNPRVRAKATVCVHNGAARLNPEGIIEFGLPALLRVAGAQIIDRLPEARDSARKLASLLHAAHRDCLNCECSPMAWEDMCTEHLPSTTAHTIIRLTGGAESSMLPSETQAEPPVDDVVAPSAAIVSLGKVFTQMGGKQSLPFAVVPSSDGNGTCLEATVLCGASTAS